MWLSSEQWVVCGVPVLLLHSRSAADGCRMLAFRQVFRCQTDCESHPTACVNAQLYEEMADHLASDGYLAAGCANKTNGRSTVVAGI